MTNNFRRVFYYGYVIVFVAIVFQMLGNLCRTTYGVFFNPLMDEFGWTRATISGAISVNYVLYGMLSIIAGRLSDRFGPRLVMSGCSVIMGLGCMLMSAVNEPFHIYLIFGFIVALGSSGLDVVLLSTLAKWFTKRRGTMAGIAKVGAGLSIFVLPLLANWLISAYGWRMAYIISGIFITILLTGLAQLLKRDPAQIGLLPDGVQATDNEAKGNIDNGPNEFMLRDVLKKTQFWMLCAVAFMAMFCTESFIVHLVPHAIDMKVPSDTAAFMIATYGAVSIVGRVLMGIVGDRIGRSSAMIICLAVMTSALTWLQFAAEPWMLFIFAIAEGFAHGAFYALLSPIVADIFGLKAQGAILGVIYFVGTAGGSVGPYLGGLLFDLTGTYAQFFIICLILAFSATTIMSLLKRLGAKQIKLV